MPHSSRQTVLHNMLLTETSLHLLHTISLFLISSKLKYLNTTQRGSSDKAVMRKMKMFQLWSSSCVETGNFWGKTAVRRVKERFEKTRKRNHLAKLTKNKLDCRVL